MQTRDFRVWLCSSGMSRHRKYSTEKTTTNGLKKHMHENLGVLVIEIVYGFSANITRLPMIVCCCLADKWFIFNKKISYVLVIKNKFIRVIINKIYGLIEIQLTNYTISKSNENQSPISMICQHICFNKKSLNQCFYDHQIICKINKLIKYATYCYTLKSKNNL